MQDDPPKSAAAPEEPKSKRQRKPKASPKPKAKSKHQDAKEPDEQSVAKEGETEKEGLGEGGSGTSEAEGGDKAKAKKARAKAQAKAQAKAKGKAKAKAKGKAKGRKDAQTAKHEAASAMPKAEAKAKAKGRGRQSKRALENELAEAGSLEKLTGPGAEVPDPDGLREKMAQEVLFCLQACKDAGTLNKKGKHAHPMSESGNLELGDEIQLSVYWTRNAVGVKRKIDDKFAQVCYFSRPSPCCCTNIVLAKKWVPLITFYNCFRFDFWLEFKIYFEMDLFSTYI